MENNLGTVYRNLGELERAKEYHILAIEIEKEKLGPQHVGLATRKTWSTTCLYTSD